MSKEAVIEVRKEDNAINLETFTTMCGPDVGLGTGTWISRLIGFPGGCTIYTWNFSSSSEALA